MRTLSLIVSFLLLGCAFFQAQNTSPQPSSDQTTDQQQTNPPPSPATQRSQIDPVKAADIRQLMEVTGVKALMTQTMGTMSDSIKPLMTSALPPGEYREKLVDLFFAKFKSKADPQQLLDSIAPLYDKYLTDDEIKGLIQFYQTPLGQKAVNVMPKLVAESQQEGRKWGEALGRQSMMDVLSENPELEKAMENARKPAP